MRPDLQALLTGGPPGQSVSLGRLPDDKTFVITWLYLKLFAPNINFNIPTLVTKVSGMQGVDDYDMFDLQIAGAAPFFGYGGYTWEQLVATARGAINGPGVIAAGLSANVSVADCNQLQNYALLTACKTLNDAS